MKTMTYWRSRVLSLVIMLTLLPCAAYADLLWDQPNKSGGAYLSCTFYSVWKSDDFQLNVSSNITSLSWKGGGHTDTLPEPDMAGFYIRFYNNFYDTTLGFNRPADTAIITYYIDIDDIAKSDLISGTWYYTFTADLPSAFVATANKSYWLSVQADTSGTPYGEGEWWGWLPATTQNFNPGVTSPPYQQLNQPPYNGYDMSMQLYGNQVPIPPSALLLGCGLLGLLALGGRRRE